MSNIDLLDATGLQTKDLPTLISDLETDMKTIYGNDIIITSNTPDGQIINIEAQAGIDIRELLTAVNAFFDPDQAEGVVLDSRCKINNIRRLGGTFTLVDITIVVSKTVTLQGLDSAYNDINGTGYTIQDNSGNKFILLDTVTLTAGTYIKSFRAANIGAVLITSGTITTPVTIELAVTSITNPTGASTLGANQEIDVQLKIRRSTSQAINSSGYLNGLIAYLKNLTGVTDAKIDENFEDTTNTNGTPDHCIWVIVEGGSSTDIGLGIYAKKAPGCNMKGNVEYDIIKDDGGTFTAAFDRPSSKNLHIKFNFQDTVSPSLSPDLTAIKTSLVALLDYKIGDFADSYDVATQARAAIAENGGGGVPTDVLVSTDGTNWYDLVKVVTIDQKFVPDISRITITEVPF